MNSKVYKEKTNRNLLENFDSFDISTTHQHNITSLLNNIHAMEEHTELLISNGKVECRNCHDDDSGGELIAPCMCSGSIKYVCTYLSRTSSYK